MNSSLVTSAHSEVLDYALWYAHKTLGHYSSEEVDLPEIEPALSEGKTLAFFDDAAVIIEYTSRIRGEDRDSILGNFLAVLDELKLLRLGEMTEFKREHLVMIDVLRNSGDYDWASFERINDPEKWKQWWISLASHPERKNLTEKELVIVGHYSLDFVYPELYRRLNDTFTDMLTVSMMKFILDAISKGVYPWDYK